MKEFHNEDCLTAMKKYKDNYFGLALIDPPYGDANGGLADRFGERFNRYTGGVTRTGGTWAQKDNKKIVAWDVAPGKDYFSELFRISRKIIIWGGNYFDLPPNRNFIVWRKTNIPEKFTMAMCEYAWTNIPGNAKVFDYPSTRDKTSGGFHPTEKPTALYKWLLHTYAEPGDVILDTHVGSGSSLIACEELGFDYVGFEIDGEYYQKAKARLEEHNKQISFF